MNNEVHPMSPRFVEKPAFTVAGVTATGHPAQLDHTKIWDMAYMPLDSVLHPLSLDGGYYGVTTCENETYRYLAGMAIREGAVLPPGAESRTIPAARYAVMDCDMNTIGATWREAYESWLPASSFALDTNGFDFEFYPPVEADGVQKVEIYIPVKERVRAA